MQGGGGDKVVPRAFVDTLRVLTDQAPSRGFADVDIVLREDLGASGTELFASVEAVPIAAASLAQVHVAVTHDGQKCALKVQYPELRANMASDLAVFRTMGAQARVVEELRFAGAHSWADIHAMLQSRADEAGWHGPHLAGGRL
jgi:predicted unusual protein kinase regulating ubiquinone biosynthesis (AarF/ABC1/UbiB family)